LFKAYNVGVLDHAKEQLVSEAQMVTEREKSKKSGQKPKSEASPRLAQLQSPKASSPEDASEPELVLVLTLEVPLR
jgi:hypothetical protein